MEIKKIKSKWEIAWHDDMPYYTQQEFKRKMDAREYLSRFPEDAESNPRLYTREEVIDRATAQLPADVVQTEVLIKDYEEYVLGYVDASHAASEYEATSSVNTQNLFIGKNKLPSYAVDIRGGEYRHQDCLYPALYDLKGDNSALLRARNMGIGISETCEYRGNWRYNTGYFVTATDYIRIRETYKLRPRIYVKTIAQKIAEWLTDDPDEQEEIENTINHNRKTGGTACAAISEAYRNGDREWAEELLDRAEAAEYRHTSTPYDDYLRSGMDRDTAREIVRI